MTRLKLLGIVVLVSLVVSGCACLDIPCVWSMCRAARCRVARRRS